jgi:hypothetical protein
MHRLVIQFLLVSLISYGCSNPASPVDSETGDISPDSSNSGTIDGITRSGEPCSANADCGGGICDPIDGICVECLQDSHCPQNQTCVGGQCFEGLICQPGKGTCNENGDETVCNEVGTGYLPGTPCDDGVDCTEDSCSEGMGCTYSSHDDACEDYNDCTYDSCLPGIGCHYEIADECKTGAIADLQPSKISFPPTISWEQTNMEQLQIINSGLGSLMIMAVTIESDLPGFSFKLDDNGEALTEHVFTDPLLVPAGEATALTVLFQPEELGDHSATLVLTTNDSTKPQGEAKVQLFGEGVSNNCIRTIPQNLSFGAKPIGSTYQMNISLENCGDGLVPIYAVKLLGNTSGVFTIIAALTPPFDLDVSQTTVITIGFTPANPGESYTGKVRIDNAVPQTPSLTVPLSGSAAQ